jgi:hypothetical protein
MTIRVEADLRERFTAVVEREHRPVTQVLRDFMRAYVEKAQARTETRPRINAAERERRQAALDYARASVELEGFKICPEAEEHGRRFINGEIDLPEFVKGHEQYHERDRNT